MNILRRLPISRLLLLCASVVIAGASLTALAFALGSGPTPAPKPLAVAVHDALGGGSVQGVSASVTLTNHLLEGANLASGGKAGELASNPLLAGASGRLWISGDGRVRLELQSEKGDTQVLYDGHTLTLYDTATNTVYRYVPKHGGSGGSHDTTHHEPPSVSEIEESISRLSKHLDVSGATPTNVAGQPAYTVHVSPKEGGSLIGGAELSFDAVHGVPLRAAVYSSDSPSPVIELAAQEISYGPVADSVFAITPPSSAKVQQVELHEHTDAPQTADGTGQHPHVSTHGQGLTTIAVVEEAAKAGTGGAADSLEGLPKVNIDGTSASELGTELGTLLSFERSGVRYIVGGLLPPSAVEAYARGL